MPPNGEKEEESPAIADTAAVLPDQECEEATKLTCEMLCSLSNSCSPTPSDSKEEEYVEKGQKSSGKCCPKQHQLPMFLSKTYHMVDRSEPEIASWSEDGDNFVVKNVELFASKVLPQYFKHSNFSSFARQLNFYGFRKLKAEPILTADYDSRTACYVRFYHPKFKRGVPELMKDIKRATKSDMQSKDCVDEIKCELTKLKESISTMSQDYDRKLAEMSYEYNRRITTLTAEYDRLAMLVQQVLAKHGEPIVLPNHGALPVGTLPDLMHSLSQAASMSLQNGAAFSQARAAVPSSGVTSASVGAKRPAVEEMTTTETPPSARSRTAV